MTKYINSSLWKFYDPVVRWDDTNAFSTQCRRFTKRRQILVKLDLLLFIAIFLCKKIFYIIRHVTSFARNVSKTTHSLLSYAILTFRQSVLWWLSHSNRYISGKTEQIYIAPHWYVTVSRHLRQYVYNNNLLCRVY